MADTFDPITVELYFGKLEDQLIRIGQPDLNAPKLLGLSRLIHIWDKVPADILRWSNLNGDGIIVIGPKILVYQGAEYLMDFSDGKLLHKIAEKIGDVCKCPSDDVAKLEKEITTVFDLRLKSMPSKIREIIPSGDSLTWKDLTRFQRLCAMRDAQDRHQETEGDDLLDLTGFQERMPGGRDRHQDTEGDDAYFP